MKTILHWIVATTVCIILCFQGVDGKGYRGYQVLKVEDIPEDAIELIVQLVEGYDEEFDPENSTHLPIARFWKEPLPNGDADIMVAGTRTRTFKDDLKKLQLKFKVVIRSVHNLILKNRRVNHNAPAHLAKCEDHNMTWDCYHPVEDFHSYFRYLEKKYPNLFYTEVIGTSFENRPMIVAKICKGGCNDTRPAMWIDAGIHANEWIGPASLMYLIRELVENNDAHTHLTDKLDWYLLPSLNPDGYAYSRENTTHRLWRKTRSIQDDPDTNGYCIGVDANRNYDFHWNEEGGSSDPCSDQYQGPYAFSEVELQNVEKFLTKHVPNIKFANSMHSYGENILIPWSHSNDSRPQGFEKMVSAAKDASDAIANVHGRRFEVNCIPCVQNPTSGAASDWLLGVIGAPYVYNLELRDKGRFGFLLPPDEIIESCEEAWAFHELMANVIIDEFMMGEEEDDSDDDISGDDVTNE